MNSFLKKLIFLTIIIIILIVVILYLTILKSDDDLSSDTVWDEGEADIEDTSLYSNVFSAVFDRNDYFAVKNIINNYFSYITYVNGDIRVSEEMTDDVDSYIDNLRETGIQSILDMLDDSYVTEFNVDDSFVEAEAEKYTSIGDYSESADYSIVIEDLYVAELSYTSFLFLADVNVNNNSQQMLIKLDRNNSTFSIFLEDFIDEYGFSIDMSESDINISDDAIEISDYNTFDYNTISDESMAREYFDLYKYLFLNDTERLYSLLNEEYRNLKYTSLDDFEEYIRDAYSRVENSTLSKYEAYVTDDDVVVYLLLDNFDNCLIIQIANEEVLNFDIQLDDYTIPTDEFIESYTESDDTVKVSTDIQVFFKMINNKDYNAAYSILDESFKATNFPTVEDFKTYVQSNFFDYNVVNSLGDFSKVSTYYSGTVRIYSSEDDSEDYIEQTFIVSLEDGTDFTMSFTIGE